MVDDSGHRIENADRWHEFKATLGARVTPPDDEGKFNAPVGVDAIAWYCSFHCFKEAEWGIYIPLSSIPFLDETYFAKSSMDRSRRWALIWKLIVSHELMHFYVDRSIAWFELLHHVPLRNLQHLRQTKYAAHEFHSGMTYVASEEALANAFAIRQLKLPTKFRKQAYDFFNKQPAGYRDGVWASNEQAFRSMATETLRTYLTGYSSIWKLDLAHPAVDLLQLLPTDTALGDECPIRIIDDLHQVGLSSDAVRAFCNVTPIEAGKKFSKTLNRMHPEHISAWQELKKSLEFCIPPGAKFKKWKGKNTWAVRVNDSIRAHLVWRSDSKDWLAQAIGHHTEMGHG